MLALNRLRLDRFPAVRALTRLIILVRDAPPRLLGGLRSVTRDVRLTPASGHSVEWQPFRADYDSRRGVVKRAARLRTLRQDTSWNAEA